PGPVGAVEVRSPCSGVCFTRQVLSPSGRSRGRSQMEAPALAGGLHPVPSMSKTRTDVLVTAEAGTQSGKARKAREYGKPVLDAGQLLVWLAAREVPVPD